jgi:hypothetical protein
MRDDELVDKFLGCLEWGGIAPSVGREVAERVLTLEDEPSVESIVSRLAGAGVQRPEALPSGVPSGVA